MTVVRKDGFFPVLVRLHSGKEGAPFLLMSKPEITQLQHKQGVYHVFL
jgi:hypothetical protein